MTPRYALRPKRTRAWDDYYPEHRETMTVLVTDDEPVDTGLVDQWEVPIVRLSERGPVGFMRRK